MDSHPVPPKYRCTPTHCSVNVTLGTIYTMAVLTPYQSHKRSQTINTMAVCIVLLLCLGSCLALPHGHYDEEAVFLIPADRQADLGLAFPQLGESFAGPELIRRERDGGSHHMAHGRGRSGRQNGRLRQQPRQNRRQRPQQNQRRPPQQSFRKRTFQELRGGRQSGATGLALGVVNNTPTQDGSFNFK
jgi:hypothetical protein